MSIIDADTHVIECEQTWAYFDKADKALRPKIITSEEPVTHKRESPMARPHGWPLKMRVHCMGCKKR